MKMKQNLEPKFINVEKITPKAKLKSLRPMRSMVAVRSLKPKTSVATLAKSEEMMERH